MSMRVRLKHQLGQEYFELPEQGVDAPLYVGRTKEAAVKVPSLQVQPMHCAVFVHKGKWALQDLSGGQAFINNKPISKALLLKVGDRIALGANPSSPVAIVIIESFNSEPVQPAVQVPATESDSVAYDEASDDPVDFSDDSYTLPPELLSSQSVAPKPPGSYVLRGQTYSTNTALVVCVIGIIVLIGGVILAGLAINRHNDQLAEMEKEIAERAAKNKANEVVNTSTSESKLFAGIPGSTKPAPITPVIPNPNISPNPSTETKTTGPLMENVPAQPANPGVFTDTLAKYRDDPLWQRVLEAHDLAEDGLAIYRTLEYKKANPLSPLNKEADQVIQNALDTLWWRRVNELVAQSKQLHDSAKDIREQIAHPGADITPDSKEGLQRQAASNEADAKISDSILANEMGWTSVEPVPVDDPALLEGFRLRRNSDKFNTWSQQVLASLQNSRGSEMPWMKR